MISKSFLFVFIVLSYSLFAQTKETPAALGQEWTLEQCINYAWEHNLQVKQAVITRDMAKNNLLASKANLLPNLNGFVSNTNNYGLSSDPFTDQVSKSAVVTDNFQLSSNFTIFNGFQSVNTMKQNEYIYSASQYDLQSNKNNLALNIASGYLQVLLNEELLQEAKDQQEVSAQQVEKTQKMVDAGSLAKGNLYEVQAQEASDEVNTVNAENQLNISYLTLAQLLDIDSVQLFKITKPEITIPDNPAINSPDLIYSEALTNQPDVKSAQLKWEGSEKGRLAAAGAFYPKLSLALSIFTGYSSQDESLIPSLQETNLTGLVVVSGVSYPISIPVPSESYSYQQISFGSQLSQNLNKSIGFQLNIPIFNGLHTNIAYKNARLDEQNSYYNYLTSELNLRKNVQQAYADAFGALNKYHATQKSVESFKESYTYIRAKFDAGVATALDYNTAKTNLAKAESDMLQAKYTYVFKLKVLDYYEGKALKL